MFDDINLCRTLFQTCGFLKRLKKTFALLVVYATEINAKSRKWSKKSENLIKLCYFNGAHTGKYKNLTKIILFQGSNTGKIYVKYKTLIKIILYQGDNKGN